MKTDTIMAMLDKVAEALEPVSNARLAAAVVYKNDIIAIGVNQNKTHPFQRRFAKHEGAIYLHAEVDAIKNAMKHISLPDLAKSKLYISRIKYETGSLTKLQRGLAKPCSGCSRAIATFNIKHVCFTTDNNQYEWL